MFLDERFTHKEVSHKVHGPTPSKKRSTSFSVGLPRTMWPYFVCVLSVLYTLSLLILRREGFPSSAITPSCVLIGQKFAHASGSKGCECVMRTWLRFATERKKKTKPEFQLGRFPWKARVKKERIDLFTVLFKCAPRGLFIETFIMEKVTCWYHTDHNPNSGVLPTDKYCVTAFDKSGLNNNTTHTKHACMCKDFEFSSWCFEIQA